MGTLAASVGVGAALRTTAFRQQVSREVAALFQQSEGVTPTVLTEADLTGLPEPVQRWLRSSGVVGKARPVTIRLKQVGQLRPEAGQPWLPFTAEQYYSTDPPGFVWVATVRAASVLPLMIGRDRYFAGKGSMQIRLLSLIPINAEGPEVDQGAMLRYLGEVVWFPAAAVSPYLTWESVDERSARATMDDGGIRASAIFSFNELGEVMDMVAERYRASGGKFSLERWRTLARAYRAFNGVWVPTEAEAIWQLNSGDLPDVRLRVTEIEYNRAAMY